MQVLHFSRINADGVGFFLTLDSSTLSIPETLLRFLILPQFLATGYILRRGLYATPNPF